MNLCDFRPQKEIIICTFIYLFKQRKAINKSLKIELEDKRFLNQNCALVSEVYS